MTSIAIPDLRTPLARYAERFHRGIGDRHQVVSPLGAWLLLALAAPAATGAARDEVADALGLDVPDAARVAAELLGHPHPQVLSGAAGWLRPAAATGAALDWLSGLPSAVSTGDLPDQAGADAWAGRHTAGLIDRFPLRLTPDTLLVLASVLATRVSWEQPFEAAPASSLGAGSPWTGRLKGVLRTPEGHAHRQFIAATEVAGDVAVHAATASGGLTVVSVAAAPGVSADVVLPAAYRVAVRLASGEQVRRRSLFDLPLRAGPLWTITERPAVTTAPDGREEHCVAVLPAWSARGEHELSRPELGFPAVAGALAAALGVESLGYQARQSAMARYHRVGFEAAAVSGMAVLTCAPATRDGVLRSAELRFGHPYAVVAVATDVRRSADGTGYGPWHGLPVFSAWVADPEDVGPDAAPEKPVDVAGEDGPTAG